MAGHRTEDLFGGDFYVESDDVTRGVQLGGTGFATGKAAFPPGKGQADPFAGDFEKEGFVSAFGDVDFLTPAPRLTFGAETVDIPKRPLEGRSYLCAKAAAPQMLAALVDFLETECDAAYTSKAAKCGLKVEASVRHEPLHFKVRFSQAEDHQVGVSFLRKRGDAVAFTTTTTEAAAHMAAVTGRDLILNGEQQCACVPPPLALPAGLMPPSGFLAPPPLGLGGLAPPPLGGLAPPPLGLAPAFDAAPAPVTEDDMQPLLAMLEDTSDGEGPKACLQLFDTDPSAAAQALAARWALCEEQLRNGCVLAATALCAKVLEELGAGALAASACAIALERVTLEGPLGRRQLARLLHQAAPLLPDSSLLARIDGLGETDPRAQRHLSEAALALRAR